MINWNCVVWNFQVNVSDLGETVEFDSPRAGGRYRITGTAEHRLRQACGEAKESQLSATEFVLASNLSGIVPVITTESIERVLQTKLPSFEVRAQRLLQHIMNSVTSLSDVWSFHAENKYCHALCGAWIHHDVEYFLDYLKDKGLISLGKTVNGPIRVSVRPEAHIYMDGQATELIGDQVFVAMWFGEEIRPIFDAAIAPAITRAGYRPKLITDTLHNRNINTEIVGEIRRSKVLVADFSCPPDQPRGGVYFEAGFAVGLGIPVIWTCRESSRNDLHFDTRQYNHILWSTGEELARDLENSIRANVGQGPNSK